MTLLITFIFGSIYGISDELHQYFVPGRSVEFLDWVADTLGSTSGAILSMFYRRWQSR
jgi:VanZ family protein